MSKDPHSRNLSFDAMNILACMAVVFLHHNAHVYNYDPSPGWIFSLAADCIFYWAVPVFLMISGANLMDYHRKYSTKEFLARRFRRTFLPWLIWSILILVWKNRTGQFVPEGSGLGYYLNLLLTNQADSTFWFFTTLFTCYLMLPVLTRLTSHESTLWYMVITVFFLSSVLPFFRILFGFQQRLVTSFHEPMILYFLLGYLLSRKPLKKGHRLILYAAAVLGTLFRFLYTLHFSVQNQALDTTIKSYTAWFSVFLSAAVFVFFQQVDWERILPPAIQKMLPRIASCSFGIYLSHKIVMYYHHLLFPISRSGMEWKTIRFLLTYLVTLTVISLLRKIPIAGKYLC